MSIFLKGFLLSPLYNDISKHPQLLTFMQCVKHMPLRWRKLALQVTRVQVDPLLSLRLREELDCITRSNLALVNPITSIIYTTSDFADSLKFISTSIYLCSVVSYVVRAEIFSDPTEPAEIRYQGILKEISALQQCDTQQRLDYLPQAIGLWFEQSYRS